MGSGGRRRRCGPRAHGSATEPCPVRSITGRFDALIVKCGQPVGLEADGSNIPDGTTTRFSIRHFASDTMGARQAGSDRNIARVQDRLRSGQVRGREWVAKKVFEGWDRTIDFRVSAGGASADSENRLNIYQYPNITWPVQTMARSGTSRGGTTYSWTAKFEQAFTDKKFIVTVKLKLVNRAGRMPRRQTDPLPAIQTDGTGSPVPVDDRTKRRLKRSIESFLSDRWVIHRLRCRRGRRCNCRKTRECCKFRILVRVQFVETGQHHEVNLFQGSSSWMCSDWWCRVPPGANAYAHEVGHMLGWYDEYPTGANDTSSGTSWRRSRAGAIMSYAGAGRLAPRLYYEQFRAAFAGRRHSEPWELLSR
jgi:hypothetical protein